MSRRAWVIVLDLLAATFAVVSASAAAYGGFVIRLGDLRISFRSPEPALIWCVALACLRFWLDRSHPPMGITRARWERWVPARADPFHINLRPGFWLRTLAAAAGIAAAVAILLHDQLSNPFSVPDHGDPLFSMWRVGWVVHQLASNPSQLFDANIFYPEPLTLTFSDPMILTAIIASPLVTAGVHPVIVYQAMLLFALWMSGVAVYLLVERLTGSARAAFVSGVLYACYSFRFDHYSHLELQMTQWMPLGLLALHLFLTSGRWAYALAVALAGVAQLYSTMYFAVFFVVYVTVVGIGLVLTYRASIRRLMLPSAIAVLVAVVLTVPLARAFLAAQPAKGERSVEEVEELSATPLDYARAPRLSATWGERLAPTQPEHALFPGLVPLVLTAVALVPPLSGVRLVYLVALAVTVEASLGFNGALYPLLYEWVPAVRGLRAPVRFGALVGMTLTILAGFGMVRILRRTPQPATAQLAFVAVCAAALIDSWPALNLTPVWKDPPAIYTSLPPDRKVVLAEFPVENYPPFNVPYMYFSLWHWRPMINGYSGFVPQSYAAIEGELHRFIREPDVALLREKGVTHVTINCGLGYFVTECDELADRMQHVSGLRLVASSVWQGRPVALYEVRP